MKAYVPFVLSATLLMLFLISSFKIFLISAWPSIRVLCCVVRFVPSPLVTPSRFAIESSPSFTPIWQLIYKLIKNTELEIPFLLASQCGLRPSEICALTKDCITADGLEIRKAVVINEHGREVYKPPKSYAGYRTIPISPLLRDKLMNTPDKKRICVISSNKISRDWNSFLRKHGLHIFRFYSLRHYYASQALLLGIPQKYIAELMGPFIDWHDWKGLSAHLSICDGRI